MNSSQQFALPDVGEGLTEAEITAWFVKVGDVVAINDTIVEIETAKSAVELPSPYAGVVQRLLFEEGDTAEVGAPIIEIGPAGTTVQAEPAAPTVLAVSTETAIDEDAPQVLVGPGPTEAAARRRTLAPHGARGRAAASVGGGSAEGASGTGGNSARATPPARLLAKTLGVDIDAVARSTGKTVTPGDVEAAATAVREPSEIAVSSSDVRESRIPIRGVRKMTAEAMVRSAFTAPHVTEWLTVDVTPTMQLLSQVKEDRSWSGVRVNPLVLVARAFLLAVKAFPEVNATWDESAREIVVKHYVNLGIAAATPRGLIVPNIKDAHELDVRGLAHALSELVAVARSGKTPPADMADGTITITNIGALGVDAGTPILNPGESAILAFGTIRQQPWVVDGRIEIRHVTQLAMSFDHRLVDGELGSHVLARTGALLSNPGVTLLHV
ncbi:dihydrolipoamide acetyltransferase family protein [Rhodococcoides yunnanense]|uniref:dihydrolipoamide acetyltransferase family protein n=1 Tax=Rhodococcoides yunnanense TaxID=278209 RepID=UPI0009337B7A|nr:dihydrolipoamide acetyltransferase family protein [Rhodococcus yunnanensis]